MPLFAWLVTRARIRPVAESIALLAFAVMYAAVMMLVYLGISATISLFMNLYNRLVAIRER